MITFRVLQDSMANEDIWQAEAKVPRDSIFFAVVEEAYRVFAGAKPASMDVCNCCMDPAIEADFLNPPIDRLPLHYIQDWYYAACESSGVSKATWAYLLPRILEILAVGGVVSNTALEVSLKRFDTGNPQNWSIQQWSVLDNFQRLYLRHSIEHSADYLDDVICMFSSGGWRLSDLLEQVALTPDAMLARRFWHDWASWPAPGSEDIWITAFWEGPDRTAIFEFYTSRVLYERMEALAFASETGADLAQKAMAVASIIERHTEVSD